MMALLLPFCSCGKAHHGAANLELFRSLSGMEPGMTHLNAVMPSWSLGRLIMVPPIPGSSARCQNLFAVFLVIVKLIEC